MKTKVNKEIDKRTIFRIENSCKDIEKLKLLFVDLVLYNLQKEALCVGLS